MIRQRQVLVPMLAVLVIAAVIAGAWSATDFNSRWCGSQTAWFRMVRVLAVDLWILLAAGLVCLAASAYSHRVLHERLCAMLLAATPFLAAIAFLATGWFVRQASSTGLFSGVSVTCLSDSRSFFQHLMDSLFNLWRNNRVLLVGNAVVVAVLIGQISSVAVASRSSSNPAAGTE